MEIGVTIREQCAALNDSLQIRLGPRWSSAGRRGVHLSILKVVCLSRGRANAPLT